MRTVADYLAIGAEYGILQAKRVHIWFVWPVIHEIILLVIQYAFQSEDAFFCCTPDSRVPEVRDKKPCMTGCNPEPKPYDR
jgi:hypothetical protein